MQKQSLDSLHTQTQRGSTHIPIIRQRHSEAIVQARHCLAWPFLSPYPFQNRRTKHRVDMNHQHQTQRREEGDEGGRCPRQVFPYALYDILDQAEQDGYGDVVSWMNCGSAFKIHKREAFVTSVLPRFFKLTKYKSFSRQLNLWGYTFIESGPYRGACKC